MARLPEIVSYVDQRLKIDEIKDFPGASNGLQVANKGVVKKIGAAVDANLSSFQEAARREVDFLVVHHGLFWEAEAPLVGARYQKWALLFEHDIAIYSSHLPLDCHPDLGNNVQLLKQIGLSPKETFGNYQGRDIGCIAEFVGSRHQLRSQLEGLFPKGIKAIEYGSTEPNRVAVLTGSGQSVIKLLKPAGVDTLITGELKQQAFSTAQDEELNLYICGHYATETFGVRALAQELAEAFSLPWEFIPSCCIL